MTRTKLFQSIAIGSCVVNVLLVVFCLWQTSRVIGRIDKYEASPANQMANKISEKALSLPDMTKEEADIAIAKQKEQYDKETERLDAIRRKMSSASK